MFTPSPPKKNQNKKKGKNKQICLQSITYQSQIFIISIHIRTNPLTTLLKFKLKYEILKS